MNETYHIHISGLVQGVGFRPFVNRLAKNLSINGWVSNGNDGVHIRISTDSKTKETFIERLNNEAPSNAIIKNIECTGVDAETFSNFYIEKSNESAKPDLFLTPDIAICPNCLEELYSGTNKREGYPFITCLNCGPRYSITKGLPYDRISTTMAEMELCEECKREYNDIEDIRHYSQNNSCPSCAIEMQMYNKAGQLLSGDTESILLLVNKALTAGQIIAVKGIGGYLLLCDATKKLSITLLRERKKRPSKPFAVLYSNIEMLGSDLSVSTAEKDALTGKIKPIVLCNKKISTASGICAESIAPGLNKIGAMLPYSGLLHQISSEFGKPLVATSGNISGSPITYLDEDALKSLTEYADFIVSFNREIVTPQDDSVIQFTSVKNRQIILRRSRGLAPNYYFPPFSKLNPSIAFGGELKSAFAIYDKNVFVSQFLGDQENYEAQLSYRHTLDHLTKLMQITPEHIYVDAHPSYHTSALGIEMASQLYIPITKVQHHEAHFMAVLAENNLLKSPDKILGVIWDGTGFGSDGQIWGGEFFIINKKKLQRVSHIKYFAQLAGNKMSKEPRVSALSLLQNQQEKHVLLKEQFNDNEREYFSKLIERPGNLQCSSMGRLLDGIASILKIKSISQYEGEAAMLLEAVAQKYNEDINEIYEIPINNSDVNWEVMIEHIVNDAKAKKQTGFIAKKVFVSLATLIRNMAILHKADGIAFSGGVFQNSLLIDIIDKQISNEFELYFHKQLSPNDECIGFGQLAYGEFSASTLKNKTLETSLIN